MVNSAFCSVVVVYFPNYLTMPVCGYLYSEQVGVLARLRLGLGICIRFGAFWKRGVGKERDFVFGFDFCGLFVGYAVLGCSVCMNILWVLWI